MKLFLLAAFPLLLYSLRLGEVTGRPSPTVLLALSRDVVKEEEGASSFPAEALHQGSAQDLSWRSMYTPVKSCHTDLREKHGEFSPPSFPNGFEGNIWCNWTIWTGSRKHIIIYIKGFRSDESCNVRGDKIFFRGVSSLVEDTAIYACWRKEVHVFATYAQGVHVVLLLRHSPHLRREKLVGKYYVFKHRETKTSPKGVFGSSEILIPELSLSVLTSLPQSEKEAFLTMWDRVNASLSASHRADRVTELSKSSLARREDARVADLPSSVWQVASTEHLIPASPSLLSISSTDNRKFSRGPETLIERTGRTSWDHLSESTTPSDVLSYVPYLSSSPLIKPSSSTKGPALPNTSWGAFIMNDPQMGNKSTQLDYLASATFPLALSHSLKATTDVNNEVLSSHSVEEVISTDLKNGMPVPEGESRDDPGSETIPLPSPEQKWIRTEMEDDSSLLPSETPERGRPGRESGSLELIFSDDHYTSEWEIRTAAIPEESTMMLDIRSVLESSMEVTDLLKTNWDITTLCGSPCRRLPSKTRNGYKEAFGAIENVLPVATEFITGADNSLNRATEMLGESRKINWEGQSSYFWGRKTDPELPFFLDEATVAPVVPTEPEFSMFSQDHDLSNIEPTLPFPAIEVEPSLAYSPEPFFLLAIPNQEPTPSYVDSVLSLSMALTYLFPFIEPDRMLSLPELSSIVLSETVLGLSLAAERPGPIPSGLECAFSETAAILQTTTELENVLSTSVTPLELAVSPITTLNSLSNEQTMFAFSPINEITSSLGLLMANVVKTVSSLSSCCQREASALEAEDLPLLTVQPSGSVDPMVGDRTCSVSAALAAAELGHLFPATETAFTVQQLSEGKNNDNFVTAPEEEDEEALFSDTVKHSDSLSETERFPSLGGFRANGQSPRNESVAETSLVFTPVTGEEKSVMNYAFISLPALTSVLSYTEMQSQAMFPSPLKLVHDATGPTAISQEFREMQPSAEFQKTALEMTITDLNVPGTLVKALPQKNTAEQQTPEPPPGTNNEVVSQVPWNEIELGFPWLMVYLPTKSCHVTLTDEAGTFSPPAFSSVQTNHWCNWTIWAGPEKHILIYIEGFEGKPDCEENQDKILFQGVASSMENKVSYACRNHGTLVFATQAEAARVVFLSKASPQNHGPKHFKGRYYIFEDYQMVTSADGDMVPEEPVLKSGSRIGVPSYAIHSRPVLDFEKMGGIPSSENSQAVSSKGRWNKTNNASSLKVLLGPAAGNYTPVSSSESTTNALDMKETQVIKPSADEYRTGNDNLPGSLKESVVLGSKGSEDKEKAILPSASPYESQKFRTRTQSAASGITTTSAGVENNGRAPVPQRPTYVKDAERAKFERSGFLSGITIPQVLLKEPRPPISSPKSIPEEDPDRVLPPWQSHTDVSKRVPDAEEFQHVETKEAAGGEQTDDQVVREGIGDRYVAIGRSRSPGTERLSENMPNKSTMKAKPHLTSSAHPDVLQVVSSLNILNGDLMGIATTSHSQVVLPDSVFVFGSRENDSILKSQHKPGDVLLEVTFGIEHKGRIPQHGNELEEDIIKSVKMQVQKRMKFFSNKVKDIKLKEIKRKERSEWKRMNDPNLMFTFWLHLVPEEKNISHFIHSQLEGLGGTSTGSGKIQQVSVGDVNECRSGMELCGDEAVCLNGYGTYFCQCKEGYEDQSLNKTGTLCVRVPPSGLSFLYSYIEIFVGATVFFIAVIVVVPSVLCTVLKKRRTKKDLSFPERASSNPRKVSHPQPVAFDLNNVGSLLTLDPACLKLRAKPPDWLPPLGSSPAEVVRVSIEQSERL